MITKELKERLTDYFTAEELVGYLVIPVEDIVEAFEDVIEERLDDIYSEIEWRDYEEGLVPDRFAEEPEDT